MRRKLIFAGIGSLLLVCASLAITPYLPLFGGGTTPIVIAPLIIASQTNTTAAANGQRVPGFAIFSNVTYVAAVTENMSGSVTRDCVAFTNLDGVAFTKLGETNFLWDLATPVDSHLLGGLAIFTLRTNINIGSNVWAAGWGTTVTAPPSCNIYVIAVSNLASGTLVQSSFNGSRTNISEPYHTLTNILTSAVGASSTVLVFGAQAVTPSGFTNASLPIIGSLTIATPSLTLLAMANTNVTATASNVVLSSSSTYWATAGLEFQ